MHQGVRLALFFGLCCCLFKTPLAAKPNGLDFTLTDQHDKTFQFSHLTGNVTMVFFGYTSCPDICPLELQHIASTIKNLDEDAAQVSGIFISIDPEKDKPAVMREYLKFFNEDLIGLTGTPAQIDQVTDLFKVSYRKQLNKNNQYTMDHSANLFIVNQQGVVDTIIPFGFPASHIEQIVRQLLKVDNNNN